MGELLDSHHTCIKVTMAQPFVEQEMASWKMTIRNPSGGDSRQPLLSLGPLHWPIPRLSSLRKARQAWKLQPDEIIRDHFEAGKADIIDTPPTLNHQPSTAATSKWLPSSPAALSPPPPVAWPPARRRSGRRPRRTPSSPCVISRFPWTCWAPQPVGSVDGHICAASAEDGMERPGLTSLGF